MDILPSLNELDAREKEEEEAMNEEELMKALEISRDHVLNLKLEQLVSHLDVGKMLDALPNVYALDLTYGVKEAREHFDWSLFGMRMRDAHNIARSLKVTETLTIINLANNAIDDERFRIICTGLLMNQTLTDLDFSHNKIGDSGARAIAKVLVTPNCMVKLNMLGNEIHEVGGKALGSALKKNGTLLWLNVRLNRLGDKGVKHVLDGLKGNSSLTQLNISSNKMGAKASESLGSLIKSNSSLTSIDISCNEDVKEDGGVQIRNALGM
eukprot:TRINITY_DN1659_c0_g1_i21.p2 TRINITY_DN1659_c0_g1~~TRINITY_DN1659_c0_g1_i21.p2  ORF type:complete len:268 (+),score=101.05 TRINITY_DN1659_c0_g1_i21:606-1409(+)